MLIKKSVTSLYLLALAFVCAHGSLAGGQETSKTEKAETKFITLSGHVPAIARVKKFDLGQVDASLPLDHLQLQLKRSAKQESDLETLLADLHKPGSPQFHKWLTADEIGNRFGVSDENITLVKDWLQSHGLEVESVNSARTAIQFSGTAAQVEETFRTEIHNLNVSGAVHISAVMEPSVPAEIASVVRGVPLTDFQPHPMHRSTRSLQLNADTGKFVQVGPAIPGTDPSFAIEYNGALLQLVAPGDFAKIYNLSPAWSDGYRGAGQTIAVVEDSLMKAADVNKFRKAFGLSTYAGTFSQKTPAGAFPCENAGINGDEDEAALDAEWAGATAPDAAIVLAACADTRTQFGGLIALQNLLSQKSPPQIISMSYGACEEELGSISLQQYAAAYQQAVAEGVSVFVSTGDEGAASCDARESYASNGITSSGFATTPYNVSVGGTDFFDAIQGSGSEYWAANNAADYTSALSYIPEKTWNDSCADSDLLAYTGSATAYGTTGFCNNSPGNQYITTSSASGGPSAIYLKPAWQNVYGVPNDGFRDIPDVSLFASNGFWGHALVYCNSDTTSAGVPCVYTNAQDTVFNMAGGTSFASPALAGIFALITQKYGRQGNPDIGFYTLAAQEYGTQSSPNTEKVAACNSTLGKTVDSSCTFYDVTHGSIDLPCLGADCYGWSLLADGQGVFGALSASTLSFQSAYSTTAGWDFATGLGSVNVANLLTNWASVATTVVAAK